MFSEDEVPLAEALCRFVSKEARMKLLVFSDSHRFLGNMEQVIQKIGDNMSGVIHLGDVCDDVQRMKEHFPNHQFYAVKGNNDRHGDAPDDLLLKLGGKKILLTHGHLQRVSFHPGNVLYWAQEREADAVLFGHTHTPYCDQSSGILLFNPGSISLPRSGVTPSFGILEITETGVLRGTVMEYCGPDCFQPLPL